MTNPTEDTAGAPPSAPAKATPPIQGHRAIISARYLPLLGEFRAKADARYYLEGIYIEPHEADGAYLVATDGHRLCVIHDESAQAAAGQLPKRTGDVFDTRDVADWWDGMRKAA